MGLSAKEREMLDRLSKKAEEPDAPPVSKSVTASINLGDPEQVKLAVKHGFLTADEAEELSEGDGKDGDGKEGDEKPNRRGFFKDE